MSNDPFTYDPEGDSWSKGDLILINVHSEASCVPYKSCVVHRPSQHSMSNFHLHFRGDRPIFERICTHGVGHPDPDQFEFWDTNGLSRWGEHGCDGCCWDERFLSV